jgi:hypothetical protein
VLPWFYSHGMASDGVVQAVTAEPRGVPRWRSFPLLVFACLPWRGSRMCCCRSRAPDERSIRVLCAGALLFDRNCRAAAAFRVYLRRCVRGRCLVSIDARIIDARFGPEYGPLAIAPHDHHWRDGDQRGGVCVSQ